MCDVWRRIFYFQRELVCRCAIPASFWDARSALADYFIRGSERSTDEMFTSTRGERRWPIPRLPNNPDRDFSAGQSEDDINANVAELFASRPLGVAELFARPHRRMRIGRLITEAMNRPTSRARTCKVKPRQASISAVEPSELRSIPSRRFASNFHSELRARSGACGC